LYCKKWIKSRMSRNLFNNLIYVILDAYKGLQFYGLDMELKAVLIFIFKKL